MTHMFLNPTVRLIKFGMMYNSRTDLIMKVNDINHNPHLQQEVMRERDSLFHLKHKPTNRDLSKFVKNCLENAMSESTPTKKLEDELKPHMESTNISDTIPGESI